MKKLVAAVLMSALIAQAADMLVVKEEAMVQQESPSAVGTVLDDTLRASSQPEGSGKIIYAKFDASGLDYKIGDITSFEGFALKSKYPRSASIFLLAGDGSNDWKPETITWNTAPGNDASSGRKLLGNNTKIGTFPAPEKGNNQTVACEWDSDAAKKAVITALNTGDRIVTFVIIRPTTKGCKFASLKNMGKKAHPLRMTVAAE